jgi:Domain of unknown function (DUF1854)
MPSSEFLLRRNSFGHLVFRRGDEVHEGVVPVRAFPLAAPEEGVALVGTDGCEVAWIERLDDLSAETAALVREELASRDFAPEIVRIVRVSSFATPSTWQVETDRGSTVLILKGEEDIRRLGTTELLIADSNGINFRIHDLHSLDRASRRLLDRFL